MYMNLLHGVREHLTYTGKWAANSLIPPVFAAEVVGLGWRDDPERYTGGSVGNGRVFYAGQVKGDDDPHDDLQLGG